MKKIISVLLLSSILCLCISCGGPYTNRGIENFDPADSSVSLCTELLPSDDFLEVFTYIDGDYYYIDKSGFLDLRDEQAIMYLIYEKEIYESAKEFTYQNLYFSKNSKYSYNGYEFMVNNWRKLEGRDPNLVNNDIDPYHFKMVAFNDKKNTIIFLGFYMPMDLVTEEIEQFLTFEDMGAFLKEYFSFYDFDA